ncbi:MAG: hypothetical protein JJE55_06850 [Flavobacteriaceae bacterium]|nr:hypothetical protein [Flavobacteriaceae bacterium]
MSKFDVAQFLKDAFGINGPISGIDGYKGVVAIPDITGFGRTSWLGTPVIYPIIFQGQTYRAYNDKGEVTTVTLAPFELPTVTLSSFSRRKNVAETELTAGYGTVKEMYGFGDWQIDIRGICLFDPVKGRNMTPQAQVKRLKDFESVAESIPVLSALYNDKGIDAIVIKEIYFEQLEGRPNTIPFVIRAVSDSPAELNL